MSEHGCPCSGWNRREFLATAGASVGLIPLHTLAATPPDASSPSPRLKQPAVVRVAFLYPPSRTFADDPEGWWSWPGNEYDAEGRQRSYTEALRKMQGKFGLNLQIVPDPLATDQQIDQLAREIRSKSPDGLLLIMFYNRSLAHADRLLEAAEAANVPVIFFIGLGVKHGPITRYRRPGLYFIQALDDFEAIEYGLRMIHTRKQLGQARLLSITEAKEAREGREKHFGITVRVIPFSEYAEQFVRMAPDRKMRDWIGGVKKGAAEIRGLTDAALENAARAHFALLSLLERHQADGLTMNCLRRGMLKPCISFSALNNRLIPAACENDLPAVYTQLIGQSLTGRPGFQHNPCYETERNHYYASHCTCATRLHGPEAPPLGYLLRRFAHTNEGSCAIQVFWQPDDPVTMVRYYPGEAPQIDVYAGRVVASHPMPPAAGCTTNVEIEITDRADACQVQGHHNLLFCGDFARHFKRFAQLFKIPLV